MARLIEVGTERRIPLGWQTRIGRHATADLRIGDAYVSEVHALISWGGASWSVRDLNSTNGTFVNSERIPAGLAIELATGDLLGFAGHARTYRVVDIGPPFAFATCGERVVEGGPRSLALPSEQEARLVLESDDVDWVQVVPEGAGVVEDGATIDVDGEAWRVNLPTVFLWAAPDPSILDAVLEIHVSEYAPSLTVLLDGHTLALPARRSWLTVHALEEALLDDRARGVPEADCGWRTARQVADGLGYPPTKFFFDLHICRGQLRAAGVPDQTDLVVRRAHRYLRLGPRLVTIVNDPESPANGE